MNQSDFAKLHGVNRKTVRMWRARGWLVMNGDDIDVESSNAQLEKYSQPVKRPETKRKTETVNEKHSLLEHEVQDFINKKGADLSLDEARRIKENYLAALTRLEYQQKEGELVEMSVAEDFLFETFRQLRDSWLNWPSRVAPLMAADLGVSAERMTGVLIEYVYKQISVLAEE